MWEVARRFLGWRGMQAGKRVSRRLHECGQLFAAIDVIIERDRVGQR